MEHHGIKAQPSNAPETPERGRDEITISSAADRWIQDKNVAESLRKCQTMDGPHWEDG